MILICILFWLSLILIIHTMIGYPVSLYFVHKFANKNNVKVDLELRSSVSVIVPAHNEEVVIRKKLENLIDLDYPQELLEIIISSDNSTDKTNEIVQEFIYQHKEYNIKLYIVKKRQGKTNAQNEAVRVANGDILVFTDANAILDKKAIVHLVSYFAEENVIYVTGKLVYVNNSESLTSQAESRYWNYDLFMRKVESNINTITTGNGAIYAIRKNEYVYFKPITCHDSAMPAYAALNKKRALFNDKVVAYEKAGATAIDEYKRKVRMFRGSINFLYTDIEKYNPFKYGWYSYFYFGHRACRRALFIFHIVCFVTNAILINENYIYALLFGAQITFYLLAFLRIIFGYNHKIFFYPYYYCMTLAAQLVGLFNHITGKSRPFWDKAESTR